MPRGGTGRRTLAENKAREDAKVAKKSYEYYDLEKDNDA